MAAWDRWAHWDIKCYDNAMKALTRIEIPSVMNKISESKVWSGK